MDGWFKGGLSGTPTIELGVGRSRRLVVAAEVVRDSGGENGASREVEEAKASSVAVAPWGSS